jgi:hypothetical protein
MVNSGVLMWVLSPPGVLLAVVTPKAFRKVVYKQINRVIYPVKCEEHMMVLLFIFI